MCQEKVLAWGLTLCQRPPEPTFARERWRARGLGTSAALQEFCSDEHQVQKFIILSLS